MASMLTGAKYNRFENTSFTIIDTTNVNAGPGQALDRLYNRVAPNAILNTGGRADEVRCYPGTCTEIIRLVNKWRLDIENHVTANQIFWLSGPAGAGKTAIVQTIAETWKLLDIHTANFFFFRTDPSRSDSRPFMSTLLYQIFKFIPTVREAVDKVLSLQPLLLDAGLEEQVDELVCSPVRSMQPPFSRKIVLLIDGLDECDSQAKTPQVQILHVLDKLLRQRGLPFLVLVASRAESHISAAFAQLTSCVQSVFLDDQYCPEADIRLFVTAEFEKIKIFHQHAASLQSDWPSVYDIDSIVQKSSGQFTYSATVMRFLSQSSAVPSLSLEKVQGIVPCAKNSPFVHLDAAYIHILQQADDVEAICDILSSALLNRKTIWTARIFLSPDKDTDVNPDDNHQIHALPPINKFLQLYNSRYTESLFISCIAEISSLVQNIDDRVVFYHASLSDFLHDRSRSGQFHVDLDKFTAKILSQPELWNHLIHPDSSTKKIPLSCRLLSFIPCTTPEITTLLLTARPSASDKYYFYFSDRDFLANVSRLYYPHDIGTYQKLLERWITWAVLTCDSSHGPWELENYCKPATGKWTRWLTPWEGDPDKGIPLLRKYLFAAMTQSQYGVVIASLLALNS